MKNNQKVLVSDLDGTLIWLSLPLAFHGLNYAWLIFVFPLVPLAFLMYLLRPRKKSVKEKICRHKEGGGRVVLVTATKDNYLARRIIRSWLKMWGVPYDRLSLRPRGREIAEFKKEVIEEERGDIFLEDKVYIIFKIGELMHQEDRNRLIRISKKDGVFLMLIGVGSPHPETNAANATY